MMVDVGIEEQDFFTFLGDFFLQKNQREIIEQKRF